MNGFNGRAGLGSSWLAWARAGWLGLGLGLGLGLAGLGWLGAVVNQCLLTTAPLGQYLCRT